MIRLAWRQFRFEAWIALGALAVVAAVLGVTGPHLAHVFATAPSQLATTDPTLQSAVAVLTLITPALLGAFFGAPLVARELEAGTHLLAWTQSVSRARWLATKFALVGVAASVLAGGLSLMVAWWANPMDVINQNRFSPANFGMLGIVPFGYALFAFALGAAGGLAFRRTIPAMVTTLVGYVGARYAVTYWVRPRFAAPLHTTFSLTNPHSSFGFLQSPSGLSIVGFPPSMANAWPLSASIVGKAGHAPTSRFVGRACPTLLAGARRGTAGGTHTHATPAGSFQACLGHLGARFHEVVAYQPASRYWPFQIDETALFVALAIALAGVSVWLIRRRAI